MELSKIARVTGSLLTGCSIMKQHRMTSSMKSEMWSAAPWTASRFAYSPMGRRAPGKLTPWREV